MGKRVRMNIAAEDWAALTELRNSLMSYINNPRAETWDVLCLVARETPRRIDYCRLVTNHESECYPCPFYKLRNTNAICPLRSEYPHKHFNKGLTHFDKELTHAETSLAAVEFLTLLCANPHSDES